MYLCDFNGPGAVKGGGKWVGWTDGRKEGRKEADGSLCVCFVKGEVKGGGCSLVHLPISVCRPRGHLRVNGH